MQWKLEPDEQGFLSTNDRVREMVVRILRNNSDFKLLGKRWLLKFMSRSSQVATYAGKQIEASRIDMTFPDLISEFYTRFPEKKSRYIKQQLEIWNIDEHTIALGVF